MQDPALKQRRYDIDWLKVLCLVLLIPYHCALVYAPGPYIVKDPHTSNAFQVFAELIGMWHIPLLFFLSGMGAWYALQFRSSTQYAKERFRRLGIPLLAGMLIFIPPQIYMERLQKHQFSGTYGAFYLHLFDGIYPNGNLTWAHLWFIAYLLVFSLLLLPLFAWLKKRSSSTPNKYFSTWKGQVFLWAIPLMGIEYTLRPAYPYGNQNLFSDWANFFFFLALVLYGFWYASQPRLYQLLVRCRHGALVLGITGTGLFYLLQFYGWLPEPDQHMAYRLLVAWQGFNAWTWIVVLCGYAYFYAHTSNAVLAYTSQAFFPVYILHQTVLIIAGYYLVPVAWPIGWKFLILTGFTYLSTWLLYEWIIRRVRFLRILLGLPTQ